MPKCLLCGSTSSRISGSIGLCVDCIRTKPDDAIPIIMQKHTEARAMYNLPPNPPKGTGLSCKLCANECVLGEGETGFCGIRRNVKGRLVSLSTPDRAPLHYYLDPHVTNCIPGDVAVMLHDGAWMRIKEIVEGEGTRSFLSYYKWKFGKEEVSGRQVFHYKGKIVKIRTETGLELEVTPDHRVLTDKEIPAYVPASELKPGDRIFTFLRRQNRPGNPSVKIARYLPEDIYVYDRDVKKAIERALSGGAFYNVRELKRHNRGIKLETLRKVCQESSMDWEKVSDRIRSVGYKERIILRRRRLTAQHAYLLGLLYSTGRVDMKKNSIAFTNASRKLLGHVKTVYRKLFENSRLREYVRGFGLRVCGGEKEVIVLEAYNPVMKKMYEDLVLNHFGLPLNLGWLKRSIVSGFLAGMLDGNGFINLGGRSPEMGFVLKNFEHAKMMLLLLRNLGVLGWLVKTKDGGPFRVVVRSYRSCKSLCKLLYPYSFTKRKKLRILLEKIKRADKGMGLDEKLPSFFYTLLSEIMVEDSLPSSDVNYPIMLERYEMLSRNPGTAQALNTVNVLSGCAQGDLLLYGLRVLSDCELVPESIREIEYLDYDGLVYDVTLERAHNFLANGVLVKNCCAAWFCPAGTGSGYPKYACRNGPEHGYYNLAIFFYGCNFDCLFCQNWSHKEISTSPQVTVEELVRVTLGNDRITCWCFFGGSPEPHLPFAINASRKILESLKGRRVMRVCFEWNGCGNEGLVKRCGELAFVSGGNIKFDLKAFDPTLSLALSGVKNDRAYRNFSMLFNEFYMERRELPVITATTLLVPGYVDEKEVEGIARFISEHDENIPYSLLIFHPDYMMRDLTITPVSQVKKCLAAAKKYLKNVNLGNVHLLSLAPP